MCLTEGHKSGKASLECQNLHCGWQRNREQRPRQERASPLGLEITAGPDDWRLQPRICAVRTETDPRDLGLSDDCDLRKKWHMLGIRPLALDLRSD